MSDPRRSRQRPPLVAVCGTSSTSAAEAQLADSVGRLIAERGAIVVCGGLSGVMEAAAQGATQAGGQTIGLLPGDDPAAATTMSTLFLPPVSESFATG